MRPYERLVAIGFHEGRGRKNLIGVHARSFVEIPYKFIKDLFTERKNGTLEYTKDELEIHLKSN